MSDSIDMINLDILALLSSRNDPKYKPSYLVRIINRSMGGTYRNTSNEGLRKGHFSKHRKFAEYAVSNLKFKKDGKTLVLRGLALLPGSFGGSKVAHELDNKIVDIQIEKLNFSNLSRIIALFIIALGTAHAFPDANGRTSIGLAKLLIDKYGQGKVLNLKMVNQENDILTQSMAQSSNLLIPEKYNPIVNFKKMERNDKKTIVFPDVSDYEQVSKYLDEYVEIIIKFVKKYKFDTGSGDQYDIYTHIDRIAQILEKSSK